FMYKCIFNYVYLCINVYLIMYIYV
ncbi:hypothetical protein EAG_14388, partial [Camponotus floridanus]